MTEERTEHRHPVEIHGRYRTGTGLAKDVTVNDLSTRGCKFFDRFCNLSAGDFLSIRIGNIGPLDAEVRWVRRFEVGLRFKTAIHPSVLRHMVPTIDGWIDAGGGTARRQDESQTANHGNENGDQYLSLRVRAPTLGDLKKVLTSGGFSLPISTYSEATDFFYRLLEVVSIPAEDESSR